MARQISRQVLLPDFMDRFLSKEIMCNKVSYTDAIKTMISFTMISFVKLTTDYNPENFMKEVSLITKKMQKKTLTKEEFGIFLDDGLYECRKAIDYFANTKKS